MYVIPHGVKHVRNQMYNYEHRCEQIYCFMPLNGSKNFKDVSMYNFLKMLKHNSYYCTGQRGSYDDMDIIIQMFIFG